MSINVPARAFLIICTCMTVTACGGWQMRGTQIAALGIDIVDLRASGAPTLAVELRRQLVNSGIRVGGSATQADATILVSDEVFDRRVLSVDANTGKVREVEVGLQVSFQLLGPDGSEVIPMDNLQWERDFVFDELALLGTVEQERVLRSDLTEDAAHSILLRLEAIRAAPQTAPR